MSDDDLLADWSAGDPITPEVIDAWRNQKRRRLEQKIERLREELAEAEQELANMEHDQETYLARDEDEPLDEVEDEQNGE